MKPGGFIPFHGPKYETGMKPGMKPGHIAVGYETGMKPGMKPGHIVLRRKLNDTPFWELENVVTTVGHETGYETGIFSIGYETGMKQAWNRGRVSYPMFSDEPICICIYDPYHVRVIWQIVLQSWMS